MCPPSTPSAVPLGTDVVLVVGLGVGETVSLTPFSAHASNTKHVLYPPATNEAQHFSGVGWRRYFRIDSLYQSEGTFAELVLQWRHRKREIVSERF